MEAPILWIVLRQCGANAIRVAGGRLRRRWYKSRSLRCARYWEWVEETGKGPSRYVEVRMLLRPNAHNLHAVWVCQAPVALAAGGWMRDIQPSNGTRVGELDPALRFSTSQLSAKAPAIW